MEWSAKEQNGLLTVSAARPDDGLGLYRAYAVGPGGQRCLLGALTPAAGRLTLRRTLNGEILKSRGCYPITSVVAELAHSFSPPPPPLPGWREPPAGLSFPDEVLRAAYAAAPRPYYQDVSGGFALAYLQRERAPFPLPALFCFARSVCLCGQPLWRFAFQGDGHPVLDV